MGGQSKKLISFKSHQRKVVPTSATKHWAPTSVPAQHARWWAHGVNDIHPSIRSSVHPWKLSKTQKEKQKLKVEKTEMTPQWWEKVSTLRPKGETVGNHIRREWKRKSWNLNCVLWALCCAVTLSLSLSFSFVFSFVFCRWLSASSEIILCGLAFYHKLLCLNTQPFLIIVPCPWPFIKAASNHPHEMGDLYTSSMACSTSLHHRSSLGWDLHNLGVFNADMSLGTTFLLFLSLFLTVSVSHVFFSLLPSGWSNSAYFTFQSFFAFVVWCSYG